MKDQYTADINDFAKYAILRALSHAAVLPLVVAWMLTAPDKTNQGSKTEYLSQPHRYRALDQYIFDRLEVIVRSDNRSVRAIEEAGLLEAARFVRRPLEDHLASRAEFFGELWRVAAGPTLLFFDPDIGIAGKGVRKGARRSSMYVFADELAEGYSRRHSLVVYQHFAREQRPAFLGRSLAALRESCAAPRPFALWSSRVAFFVVPQDQVADALTDAGQALAARWKPFLSFTNNSD
jgi:hypothetical protein